MTDPERYAMALSHASEKTKQLITLSTGILAITISFSKEILGGVVAWTVFPLAGAWLLFLLSIIFGVQVLGRFAARLVSEPISPASVTGVDIVTSASRQINCFLGGVFLTVSFGICMVAISIHDAGGLTKRITPRSDSSAKRILGDPTDQRYCVPVTPASITSAPK